MAVQGIRSSCEMTPSSFAAERVNPVASSKPNSTEGRTAQVYAAIIVGAILTFFFVKKIISVSLVVLPVAAMIYAIYRSSQAGATTGTPKTDKAEKAEGSSRKGHRLSETKALANKVFQSFRGAFTGTAAAWNGLRKNVKSEKRLSKLEPETISWGRIKDTGRLYVKLHCETYVADSGGPGGDQKGGWSPNKMVTFVMKSPKKDSSWKYGSKTPAIVRETFKHDKIRADRLGTGPGSSKDKDVIRLVLCRLLDAKQIDARYEVLDGSARIKRDSSVRIHNVG